MTDGTRRRRDGAKVLATSVAALSHTSDEAVMPGLVPGIHVLRTAPQGVDGRDKPGHDAVEAFVFQNPATLPCRSY